MSPMVVLGSLSQQLKGVSTCREWDEEARMKFLLGELTGKRPLMPPTLQTSAEQADVINTFRVVAQLPPDSLGAYVISMARSASDVLAVVLLQVYSQSGIKTKPDRCYCCCSSCTHADNIQCMSQSQKITNTCRSISKLSTAMYIS